MTKKTKICIMASAGGHLVQLLRLKEGWNDCEAVYVSSVEVVHKKLSQYGKTYIVGECNREHPIQTLAVLWRCLKVAVAERPDVVISTGAAPGFLLCFISKLLGAKIIWIDSIANVKRLSMSGRMIRPFANLFLTQWQELQDPDKNIEYVGSVI
jgi:UDP-N-acetylglucosamine:LPS N-acetylglucosamine transferase